MSEPETASIDLPAAWQDALTAVPDELRQQLLSNANALWQQLSAEQSSSMATLLHKEPQLCALLQKAMCCSDYFFQSCRRRPQWLLDGLQGEWLVQKSLQALTAALLASLQAQDSEETFNAMLRQLRQQIMMRLIFRDLNRLATLEETMQAVSQLANSCLQAALDWHYPRMCEELGTPTGKESGQPQQMVVLGMGKLGADELNLSSDIDLIFSYPQSGETLRGSQPADTRVAGKQAIDNQQFFLKLGQRLIKSIDTVTVDGFVFRVDMRLRPYGQSGALAMSFDAMEEYYQDQGRDWERYAMIKANVVAGDLRAGEQLLQMLRPFTYRRYIDFSAIESLRDMKAMITREVKRRRANDNIKIGAGGIREIEFIAQAFQLIRGGRELELQERSVQKVLQHLVNLHYLPVAAVEELQHAYTFLRNTEHAIQAWQDQQTQVLPRDATAQLRLAFAMGYTDWASFEQVLTLHRGSVSKHFQNLIASPEDEEQPSADQCYEDLQFWASIWHQEIPKEQAIEQLQAAGFEAAEDSWERLDELKHSRRLQALQKVGRERLDHFVPLLLRELSQLDSRSSVTLARLLPFLDAVLRRSAYLVLLMENPNALQQLVILCEASPWIAQQLARHPVLLDELLDAGTLYKAPEPAELRQEIQLQLLRYSADDLEAQMEGLRYFKLSHVLRVAASEVSGKLPLMKVSDYLSFIAEAILEYVLGLAWHQLTARYGVPRREDGELCDPDFIIVAYGKLGGLELGYGSDLDLVFIHDGGANQSTDGEKSVENGVFFTRLGQRIIHILTTQTTLRDLYEVDMRLRPSGSAGLLVSSLAAFRRYQVESAWTWEHQALVRARVVAGSQRLAEKFAELRREVLCKPRDQQQLAQQVLEMRQKMLDHLLPNSAKGENPQIFHLKQSRGGIVDIEFMVQYAVLAWASKNPELARWTDNIRILESLAAAGFISAEDAQILSEAYIAYRSHSHRLALQHRTGEVPLADVQQHHEPVQACWHRLLEK